MGRRKNQGLFSLTHSSEALLLENLGCSETY